ncbi:MAG: M23 family metallopeptidase [Bacteroidetes bacterium]|nr:M23 family metallopeptidase [Bacteroidota bacterium]
MTKVKYKFNKHSLTFDKVQTTLKTRLLRFLGAFSTSLVFSTVILIIAFNFFESPKEKMLQREIDQYQLQYKIMNDRIEQFSKVLEDMEERDDNIYRIIFESEPIPNAAREGAYGGVNKYTRLEGYDNSELVIVTSKKLDNIASRLYVQSKSFDDVFRMVRSKEQMLASIPAIQPVKITDMRRIGSYFGYRTDPFYKIRKFHTGIDFSAPTGTKIFATGDGVVIKASRSSGGYGNEIVIDHGFSYRTVYAHLSKFKVRVGQKVKRGAVIATVGNTGKSTAPHLHYEVLKNGVAVNPIYFFFNDLTPGEFEQMLELSARPSQTMD